MLSWIVRGGCEGPAVRAAVHPQVGRLAAGAPAVHPHFGGAAALSTAVHPQVGGAAARGPAMPPGDARLFRMFWEDEPAHKVANSLGEYLMLI